jgi:CheY-like chemotaxis protein
MMPVLDRWGVLRACRPDPVLGDLPVIVMSTRPDAAESVAGLDVQACLTKPFEVDVSLDALEEIWNIGSRCATCDGPHATQHLLVFVEGARIADWALCTSCWQMLQTGFGRLRPGESMAQYLGQPGFCITDLELHGYLRVGQR